MSEVKETKTEEVVETTEVVVQEEKEKFSLKDSIKDFSEKHPKVTKVAKRTAKAAVLLGAGFGLAMLTSRNGQDDNVIDADYDEVDVTDSDEKSEEL